jgi:hypothetical protein
VEEEITADITGRLGNQDSLLTLNQLSQATSVLVESMTKEKTLVLSVALESTLPETVQKKSLRKKTLKYSSLELLNLVTLTCQKTNRVS